MYKFKDELNDVNFFQFRKSFVRSKIWRQLPLSTKSIYPVIACHMNKDGIAYPSQETIGILSGCDPKTVREGIKGLLMLPDVTIGNKVTQRGQRMKQYQFDMPKENDDTFSFYKAAIDHGQWRVLRIDNKSNAAHAVYCTLMAFSFFEMGWYEQLEENEYYDGDEIGEFYADIFPYRKYDFVEADLSIVAYYAGVEKKTAKRASEALLDVELLKPLPDSVHEKNNQVWQIFRIPPVYFKRDYLNENLPKPQKGNEFVHLSSDLIDRDIILSKNNDHNISKKAVEITPY